MLISCQRSRGVYAGSDDDIYHPRPAPKKARVLDQGMKGELLRVDTAHQTIVMRVENGMVQTFKFDDNTIIVGLENQLQTNSNKPVKTGNSAVRDLTDKQGSEITVQWIDEDGAKLATNIDVTQIITAKNTRRSRRR